MNPLISLLNGEGYFHCGKRICFIRPLCMGDARLYSWYMHLPPGFTRSPGPLLKKALIIGFTGRYIGTLTSDAGSVLSIAVTAGLYLMVIKLGNSI